MKKINYLILVLIFLIAFALRFYKLGQVPYGFYQDESAIGYNAYSILQTGRDEYGKFMPLYFKSFGDYKLPIYIYLDALFIKTFGLNEFAVRLPSALFGFLTVVIFYFFVKELTKRQDLALLSSFLLAVNPWHLHYNRATFEVSISLFLFILGGYLLLRAFSKKLFLTFLFGTFCFLLSLYTYNLTRLLAPILYFLFIYFNRQNLTYLKKNQIILTLFLSFISLLPFALTFFTSGGISSAQGTLIFSSAVIQAKLLGVRSYFIGLPNIFVKLFFNKIFLTAWQYINNIFSYFSVDFLFISGDQHGNHGIGNVGQFYLFEFPAMLVGIYTVFKNKIKWGYFLVYFALLTVLVASLTREVPQATRSFFLILPLLIFSALGILKIGSFLTMIKIKKYRLLISIFFLMIVVYNFVYYFTSYYERFPVLYASSWRLEDKAVSLYIKEVDAGYNKIIFDKKSNFIYSSLLFYLKYPPGKFQKEQLRYPSDSEGWSFPVSFGKFEFRDIDWRQDYKKGNLIITAEKDKPSGVPSLRTFYYPKRPIVISIGQEIFQYPLMEVAYVAVAKE